jgi:hypothetical protein
MTLLCLGGFLAMRYLFSPSRFNTTTICCLNGTCLLLLLCLCCKIQELLKSSTNSNECEKPHLVCSNGVSGRKTAFQAQKMTSCFNADDELAQIRARRMAELRNRGGGGGGGGGGFPGGMMPAGMQGMGQNPQSAEEQAQKQKAADEQRAQILKAILTPQARERREFPSLILMRISHSLNVRCLCK